MEENKYSTKSEYRERINKFPYNSADRFYRELKKLCPEYENFHEYTKELIEKFVCDVFAEDGKKEKFDIVKEKNFSVYPLNHIDTLSLFYTFKEKKQGNNGIKDVLKNKFIPYYRDYIDKQADKLLNKYEKMGNSFRVVIDNCKEKNTHSANLKKIEELESLLSLDKKDVKLTDILDHYANINSSYKDLSRKINMVFKIHNYYNSKKILTIDTYILGLNKHIEDDFKKNYNLTDEKYDHPIIKLVLSGIVNDDMFRNLDVETIQSYGISDDIAKKMVRKINEAINNENKKITSEEAYNKACNEREEMKKQLRSLKNSLVQHKKRLEKANSKIEDYQDAYNVYVEEFIRKNSRI